MSDDEQKDTLEPVTYERLPMQFGYEENGSPYAVAVLVVHGQQMRKDCFLCHKLLAEGEVIVCDECNPNPIIISGKGS